MVSDFQRRFSCSVIQNCQLFWRFSKGRPSLPVSEHVECLWWTCKMASCSPAILHAQHHLACTICPICQMLQLLIATSTANTSLQKVFSNHLITVYLHYLSSWGVSLHQSLIVASTLSGHQSSNSMSLICPAHPKQIYASV